jgi:signal transduction histidine kinase
LVEVLDEVAGHPDGLPAVPGASLTVPIRHHDELLGALAVAKPAADPPTRDDVALLGHLAAQAGLVLRNLRLVDDVTASRRRLVAAQADERRRLERDLHDGAQQRLVTLSLRLRLVGDQAARSGDESLATQIADANAELARCLADLRELARGIHPTVLTEHGLGAALHSLAERAAVPVDVVDVPHERFTPAVEAAAYFLVCEALANTAKHANASSACVSVRRQGEWLVVDVADDGVGGAVLDGGSGLRGLADRVAVVAGTLNLVSPAGRGTRVLAEIPCGP